MLLADMSTSGIVSVLSGSTSPHRFIYARVLGVYHANVVYIGPGMKGYEPICFDFLHIRWFRLNGIVPSSAWDHRRLDCLSFSLMADGECFDFLDPNLVLRGCHLIPAFASGRQHTNGIGLSPMSRDSHNWKYYYVNR